MTVALNTADSELSPTVTDRAARTARAVVIGSGFGGLASAIRLACRGYSVDVVERLDQPGGRARVFRQDGFTFDAGPTIITAPFLLDELWELAGRKRSDDVDLVALDPFYNIRFSDGSVFEYSGDKDRMRSEVAKFEPDDVKGFNAFMECSARMYRLGYEDLGNRPYQSFGDLIKSVPAMLSLSVHRSVYGHVCKYIKNEKLRMVFSFHPLLIGGNPFDTTAVYSLINHLERQYGVHYAMGGTGKIVDAMVKLLQRLGGRIHYGAEVSRILVSNKIATGVELASGSTITSDVVVSNADSAYTYKNLVDQSLRTRWTDQKIERARYSMGLFVWYFGTDRIYGGCPHHSILLGPRYRGLLDDIFNHHELAEDFSLYLHRPTATDRSMAPDGCDSFYVLSPVPNLSGDIDWAHQGELYRQSIEAELSRTILPDLGRHVVTSRTLTPFDFESDYLAHRGAAFGMKPVLTQSAWFRPHNQSEEVKNLFLVGASTHPGAGVPGVLTSARVLDRIIPNAESFS